MLEAPIATLGGDVSITSKGGALQLGVLAGGRQFTANGDMTLVSTGTGANGDVTILAAHANGFPANVEPNLKELVIQHAGDPYRVLFAFDPRQTAILLIGGKKGKKKWYAEKIAEAEKLYAQYLKELKKEGLI